VAVVESSLRHRLLPFAIHVYIGLVGQPRDLVLAQRLAGSGSRSSP
jgi:hypothetical protein